MGYDLILSGSVSSPADIRPEPATGRATDSMLTRMSPSELASATRVLERYWAEKLGGRWRCVRLGDGGWIEIELDEQDGEAWGVTLRCFSAGVAGFLFQLMSAANLVILTESPPIATTALAKERLRVRELVVAACPEDLRTLLGRADYARRSRRETGEPFD